MTLITLDELARGACIGIFGGLAGVCTLTVPGSPLWLLPAVLAVSGCALTVPEIRQEAARALPAFHEARQRLQLTAPSLARREALTRPTAAPARQRQALAPAGTLRPAQWLHTINNQPDRAPHMLVTGPSGAGKSTFVSAALGQRPGRVIVVTPKVTPGSWAGAEVVTLDDELSYAPLAAAINALQTEAKRRAVALKRGEALEPLTVVLDELPELVTEVPAAGPFAVRISRWGRELRIRQIVLATSDDALNIKGWAATRPNYVRVELDRPTANGTRPAWLDDGQSRLPLDLVNVKHAADQARLRPWREAEPAIQAHLAPVSTAVPVATATVVDEVSADMLAMLHSMLATPVSSASEQAGTITAASVPVPVTIPDSDTDTDTDMRDTGTSHTRVTIGDQRGTPMIYVYAQATAPITPAAPRRTSQVLRRKGLDMRRRRQRASQALSAAQEQQQINRRDELAHAYTEHKAAGWSYRRAYAKLGGGSTETRAWWKAAPSQAAEAH